MAMFELSWQLYYNNTLYLAIVVELVSGATLEFQTTDEQIQTLPDV